MTFEMAAMGRVAPEPLRDQVLREIRRSILSGQHGPGTILPEARIAKELGVSRGPVRDAMLVLEREGLLSSEPNRRAQVRRLGVRDVDEIYSLRRSLEILASQQAVLQVVQADLDSMRLTLDAMSRAYDRGDFLELSQLDVAFHDHLYRAARHDRLYRVWSDLRSQVTLFLVSRNRSARTSREIAIVEHEQLWAALASRDASLLIELTEAHLLGAYERLRAVVVDEDGE